MNESDLRSDMHYLGSSEKCSALPTELTSQLGAGHDGGSK